MYQLFQSLRKSFKNNENWVIEAFILLIEQHPFYNIFLVDTSQT